MKRRYKLIGIILIGSLLAVFINTTTFNNKVDLVAIGDSLSSGATPYNVVGNSFNDYIKEYLESAKKIKSYNNEFSYEHLSIKELNEYMQINKYGKYTSLPIKQIIAKADIVTLAIGEDEFIDLSLRKNINTDTINEYLNKLDQFLNSIREFYDKKVIIIGLYPYYEFNKSDVIEVNSAIAKISGKYNAQFVDILPFSLNEEYFFNNTSYYFNYKGHKEISKLIYKNIRY